MEKIYNQFRNTMTMISIITWVTYCLMMVSCTCALFAHVLLSLKFGLVVYLLYIVKDILLKRLLVLSRVIVNNNDK